MNSSRVRHLKAARFDRPDRIPMVFTISPACWSHYPAGALEGLISAHPLLFPGSMGRTGQVKPKPWQVAGKPYTDPWGCVWETTLAGITGTVIHHPLASWDALPDFRAPDPDRFRGRESVDWHRVEEKLAAKRSRGDLPMGGLEHGHTFMTLMYLRGYENLILDMADGDSRLSRLIAMVTDYNTAIVNRTIGLGVEWMSYPEDLGMQVGPMLSPEHFRMYIRPSYERLMEPARRAGCVVHMHSDGDIRALADDLILGGVEVLNLQDLVNGIEWIAEHLAGRICIDLDIDRQKITRFGTPADIDALIRREVKTLGSREGGLMMSYGLYPGVPLSNVEALMDAMQRYSSFWQ